MAARHLHVLPTLSRRTLLGTCAAAALAGYMGALIGQPAAAQAPGDETITNSIGMAFVLIPAGTFLIGSPDSDAEAREFEKPQHEVTISEPFWLGRFEVTQAQSEAVMGESPYVRDR